MFGLYQFGTFMFGGHGRREGGGAQNNTILVCVLSTASNRSLNREERKKPPMRVPSAFGMGVDGHLNGNSHSGNKHSTV